MQASQRKQYARLVEHNRIIRELEEKGFSGDMNDYHITAVLRQAGFSYVGFSHGATTWRFNNHQFYRVAATDQWYVGQLNTMGFMEWTHHPGFNSENIIGLAHCIYSYC